MSFGMKLLLGTVAIGLVGEHLYAKGSGETCKVLAEPCTCESFICDCVTPSDGGFIVGYPGDGKTCNMNLPDLPAHFTSLPQL
eukprot:Awhi_evm1s14526